MVCSQSMEQHNNIFSQAIVEIFVLSVLVCLLESHQASTGWFQKHNRHTTSINPGKPVHDIICEEIGQEDNANSLYNLPGYFFASIFLCSLSLFGILLVSDIFSVKGNVVSGLVILKSGHSESIKRKLKPGHFLISNCVPKQSVLRIINRHLELIISQRRMGHKGGKQCAKCEHLY